MYWRFSSCSARSSADRSKIRASAMPMSFSAFLIVSVSNSLLPTYEIELIVGRSYGDADAPPPWPEPHVAKKPVVSAFTASRSSSSVTRSPTLIGVI
jgi:hypothetical protein